MKHVYLFDINNIARAYGIGTYLRELTQNITAKKRIRLTIVCLFCNISEFEIEVEGNIRKLNFPTPIYLKNFENSKYAFIVYNILKQYIDDNEKNVFHFNYLQHRYLMPLLHKDYPNIRICFTIHYIRWCSLIECNVNKFKSIIQKELNDTKNRTEQVVYDEHMAMKQICKYANKVICLSTYTYHLMSGLYEIPESKLTFIPNGLKDEAMQLNDKQKIEIRRRMSLANKEKIILFVGRLSKEKGAHILVNTFGKIIKKFPNVRLLIVGDGNYDLVFKDCFSFCSRITLLGKIEKETLYKLYQIADIGIQPSFNEQSSYVAIEMMMHGLPLIGLDLMGMGEMIESGYNGFKVSLNQNEMNLSDNNFITENLSLYIIKILYDEKLREKMKQNARATYQKKYTSKVTSERIFDIYFK